MNLLHCPTFSSGHEPLLYIGITKTLPALSELGTGRTGGSLVSVGEKRKSKGKDSQKSKETDNGKSKGRDSGFSGVESEVLNISASTELD